MSNKSNSKSNNRLLVGVFAVLLALIVIAVLVVVLLNNQSDPNSNESFFETNEIKYVVASELNNSEDEGAPVASYDVYYHNGDTITGHEAYYEFRDEEYAKAALSYYQALKDDDIKSIDVNGKYIVLVANPSQFEGMTLEFVKQWSQIDSTITEDVVDETDVVVEEGNGEVVEEVQEEVVEENPAS